MTLIHDTQLLHVGFLFLMTVECPGQFVEQDVKNHSNEEFLCLKWLFSCHGKIYLLSAKEHHGRRQLFSFLNGQNISFAFRLAQCILKPPWNVLNK